MAQLLISAFVKWGMTKLVATIAAHAIMVIGTSLLAKKLAPKLKISGNGVQMNVEFGDDLPLTFCMGYTATGGKRKYIGTWGKNKRYVTEVIEYSALPQGLVGLWVNDEKSTVDWLGADKYAPKESGSRLLGKTVSSNKSKKGETRIWIRFYNGTQVSADPTLTSLFGNDKDYPWDANAIGTGKSYAIITAQFDKDTLSSYPTYLLEPEPLKIYDFRKDSSVGGSGSHRWDDPSTWEISENPAIIAYNIARGIYYGGEWVYGGKNTEPWRLPLAAWIAAANAHDAPTPAAGGGTEITSVVGIQVSVDTFPSESLSAIGDSSNMQYVVSNGMLIPFVGVPAVPVFAVTDRDLLITEEQALDPFKPMSESYNAITATYTESEEKWSSKDLKEYVNQQALDEDGGAYRPVAVKYPLVARHTQAERLARYQLLDYRRDITHQIYLPPAATALQPGLDSISWTSERNGYVNKKFIIDAITRDSRMLVLANLREINPGDIDPPNDYFIPSITPPTEFVPWEQSTPEDMQVIGIALTDDNMIMRRPAIQVYFPNGEEETGISTIRVQARRQNATILDHDRIANWEEPYSWLIDPVLPGTLYEVRVWLDSDITPVSIPSEWILVMTPDVRLNYSDLATGLQGTIDGAVAAAESASELVNYVREEARLAREKIQQAMATLDDVSIAAFQNLIGFQNQVATLQGDLAFARQDSAVLITANREAIATLDTTIGSRIDGLSSTISQTATTMADVEGNLAALLAFRVATNDDNEAILEMVAADDPVNGPSSVMRISADMILLEGSVTAPMLVADDIVITTSAQIATAVIGNAHIGDLTSEVITVNSLLKVNDGGALSAFKVIPNDPADGLFFGQILDETNTPQFYFTASRTGDGGQAQEVTFSNEGFKIFNGQFYVSAGAGTVVDITVTIPKTPLPEGTQRIRFPGAVGGGGGGAGGHGSGTSYNYNSTAGFPTYIRLYDGDVLKVEYILEGAKKGRRQNSVGEVSPLTPYGDGGKGSTYTYGIKDKNRYQSGGYAGQFGSFGWTSVVGWANPMIEVIIGEGGPRGTPSYSYSNNTPGISGKVIYEWSAQSDMRADVVPLQPTTVGALIRAANVADSFPDLGPGYWHIYTANGTALNMGLLTYAEGKFLATMNDSRLVFFADRTPYFSGGASAVDIQFMHYAMGVWGN